MDELENLRARLRAARTIHFAVRATPRCSKTQVCGFTSDGALQIRLAAVPERGRANEELRCLLSQLFDVPKNRVEITSGDTARLKRIRISL